MSRIGRYWTLWNTLPDVERRQRAGRVVERLLRRRPAVRRLGLAPDPPGRRRLERALTVSVDELLARLGRPDEQRGPLFGDLGPRARAVADAQPAHAGAILAAAGRILDGRFDLLGSGETRLADRGRGPDWHLDWKSGLRWDTDTYYTDLTVVRGDGSDVKLPWELSRCQHLPLLGQAYQLAPHMLPAAEPFRRQCASMARDHIDDWIRCNPRGLGVNWTCAMEVGIRVVSWLATLGLLRDAPELDEAFVQRLVAALWMHGRHIRRNLEIGAAGLTSNHYLADITGLYALAVALPELREAGGWEALARESLEEEIQRQVHRDGVDFEHSLPYHRLVAEMFVHAALAGRARGADFPDDYFARLARMLEFTATAMRDDASVPQWGDNDDGRLLPLDGYAAADPNDHRHLLALGGRLLDRTDLAAAGRGVEAEALWLLGPPEHQTASAPAGRESRGFPDSGYYVMRSRDLHCGVSCGGVGTCGVGNHSHNDLLSVCVWAAGVEWITDPGTGCYTGDPTLRDRMRATAAHATLQLGRREQNTLGEGLDGLFRLHDRGRPEVTDWTADPRGARLVARHRGFGTERESWIHERAVVFDTSARSWRIDDTLARETEDGPAEEPIFLRFPLRPGTRAEIATGWPPNLPPVEGDPMNGARVRFAVRLSASEAAFLIALDLPEGSRVSAEEGLYSPRYGVTESCSVVTATLPPAPRTRARSILRSPGDGE